MPTRRRSAQLGILLATLLLAAGCGGDKPDPVQAIESDVPADLCATVPAAARAGLIADSSSSIAGNPTAACSLRSRDVTQGQVRAVVTWIQSGDETSADAVLDSQCRAVDRSVFRVVSNFQAVGADRACAASGNLGGVDSATLAAVSGLEVVTVRLSPPPAGGGPSALVQGQQVLEGVLGALTGKS